MTPSLVPGLSVSDTLILAEKLPAPPDAAYQVWHALNRQVGQLVIIKVYADGRVEPIENNLASTTPPVSAAPSVFEPPPSSTWNVTPPSLYASIPPSSIPVFTDVVSPAPTPVSNVLVQPTMGPQSNPFRPIDAPILPPVRKPGKRWLRYVLTGILLLGLAITGYFYRKPLRSYERSITRSITRLMHSKDQTPSNYVPKWDSLTPVVVPEPNPDTAGVDLMRLPSPPIDPNEPAIGETTDSTAVVATDTTSMIVNEPPAFRSTRRAKPARKPGKKAESLFMRDPEVNR